MQQNRQINPRFDSKALRFIAIDAGTHGAICECSLINGKITLYKLNGLTPSELLPVLDTALGDLDTLDCVIIEQPPYFMGTAIPSARIAVLFESFGIIVGYLMAKKVHVVRVTPKAWQKRLNDTLGTRGKMNHAKWKKILTDYAKSRYGETDGLIGQTADSVLIAEWWVNEGIFNK